MYYETAKQDHGLKHDPFKALVVPRPIGWISTVDEHGGINLAPYSFFNAIGERPAYVLFASAGRKDSQRNAERTGEFVCNLATWDLREAMNRTSGAYQPGVDEFELAGLQKAPSRLVKPPRVAESPVAMECKYWRTIELPDVDGGAGSYSIVIGRVDAIYIADELISGGMVDITRARPIARLGYMDYCVVDEVFAMTRPVV